MMTDVELYSLCVASDRNWYVHCHRYETPNLKRRALVNQTKALIQLDNARNHMESPIMAARRKRWRDEAIREGRLLPNCRCIIQAVSLWSGPLVKNPYAAVNPNGAV